MKRFAAFVASLSVALAAVGASPSAQAAGAAPTVGALRLQQDFDSLSKPNRYGYVILNSWEHHLIPELKAGNPDVRVLVYKDMAATVDYATTAGRDNQYLPAGVGYFYARLTHPEWFLRDTNRRRIEWCDYDGAWQMDVGNADYQRTWLANVTTDLKEHGWDGVMVDDAMADPWAHLCGRTIAKYPTASKYAAATESFLAAVGPKLQDAGFLVLPNINDADVTTWSRWMNYVSGGVREWWAKTGYEAGKGFFGDHDWTFLMDQMRVTQEAGKAFIGITYSDPTDRAAMRYARASFLLGWTGGRSALIFHTGKDLDPWARAWTAEIGTPIERRRAVQGAWRRDFTGGTVLVNPSSTRRVTVTLEPGFVRRGAPVSEVTLRPTRGLILKRSTERV
ncbi:MAG: putative glycoside hydrolase family 15 protein [Actinomycetota bacterium]|nr:putative glycoside hydrolase family 15 protein [Actinomycetota bacterium]